MMDIKLILAWWNMNQEAIEIQIQSHTSETEL